MPPVAIPLSTLAKRLSKTQLELDRLRNRYETRLENLKRRREALAKQLQEIESEIQAVTGELPEAPLTEEAAAPRGRRGRRAKLPLLIIKLLEKTGEPMTVKEIADAVRRRKFKTKSQDIPRLVQARVYELAKKGVLAHATGQPGYVIGPGAERVTSGNGAVRPKKRRGRKAKATKFPRGSAGRNGQPSLRSVLTKILEESDEPIGGGELAEKVKATGYKTKSKDLRDVVWANLAGMKRVVEHVKGQGYRLRKR